VGELALDPLPGATIGEGLAVQGQEVADAEPAVQLRLQPVGLRPG
jgi:hypothetical protein